MIGAYREVARDERTQAVENASYRLGYLVISNALLLDVMYRGFRRGESAWDLLAIIIVGGAITAGYQARRRIVDRRVIKIALGMFVLAAAVAAVIAAFWSR